MTPELKPSDAALKGRMAALAHQRDVALNENVMHMGEIAHLQEQLRMAHERISELTRGGEFATEGARESSLSIVK
jgi:hypothetical protein